MALTNRMNDFQGRQLIAGRFFVELIKPIRPWFLELVSTYKERGEFIVLPTFIEGYYDDRRDKEIALFSTLCMSWAKDAYPQVQDMRRLMGDSPWEWFTQRLFTTISVGREQDNKLEGCNTRYWQIARLFDKLWSLWRKKGRPESLSKCFRARSSENGTSQMETFAVEACKACECNRYSSYKENVIEMVLRASDGLGISLWNNSKADVRCPRNADIRRFLKIWVGDYSQGYWDFDATIRWFGFERDTDFFYLWMAWQRLSRLRPKECSRFATVFYGRYKEGRKAAPSYWNNYLPTIIF